MEISSIFRILDITNQWYQHEETQSKYANLSNVACDIFSIIVHGDGVEGSLSLGRHVIGWRQSKTTGETLHEKVIVRHFAGAIIGLLAGDNPVLNKTNTDNDSEMKR